MKKKLNARFMLIAAIAIVATAACAIILFYSILIEQIFEDLKANRACRGADWERRTSRKMKMSSWQETVCASHW